MTCSGGRFKIYGRGGTTIGGVYLTGNNPIYHTRQRIRHELKHVRQWRRYGLTFPVRYFWQGQNPHRNVYERQAGLRDGGY